MTPRHVTPRSAVAATRPARSASTRNATLNPDDRSVQAVIATEQPVVVLDFRRGAVDEVLLADGAEVPERFPVLDSHSRESTSDVIGSAVDAHREGTRWIATLRFASNDRRADEVFSKVSDGHLDSVSVGYLVLEATYIAPGQTKTVNGRQFTAGDRDLRIATKWRVIEVSVVAIPADSDAKIRATGLSILRRSSSMPQTSTPAIHSRNSLTERPTIGTLASAILLREGVNDPSQHRVQHDGWHFQRLAPSVQLERDADRGRDLQRTPLVQLLRHAAELDGANFTGYAPAAIANQLFNFYQGRAATTGALQDLFTQVFGALFLEGFDSVYDVTEGWTLVGENPNRQPAPRVRPTAQSGGQLAKTPTGASANHFSPEVVSEVTQLGDHFTAMCVIDEQNIIDNRFGNSDSLLPRMLGQAAARLRPLRVLSELFSNPTMRDGTALFHADHGNLLPGTALDDTGLQAARAAISGQTENGAHLNLRGDYLLVPEALERTAAKLAREVELMDPRNSQPPIVRSDSRFDKGIIDPDTGDTYAGSLSTWFLAAEGGPHTMEVTYLAGTGGQPRIRSGMLTQGTFGMWFDVEHYVSATALDWRGLVKCTA